MFAYSRNNPINMKDSTGNWPTWDDILSYGKKVVDRIVENAVSNTSPIITIAAKKLHYSRNILNNTNYQENELIEKGYTKEPASSDKFHQNNQLNGERNRKYVIGDWFSSEIVYYSDGRVNNTSEDMGTFNIYSGDDSTTIVDRVIMIWE